MDIKKMNQLKKGVLSIIVLKVVSEGISYGYEIMKNIDNVSDGIFDMKPGTLYPILYRLEDEKLIKSHWKAPEERQRGKKYYKITEAGMKRLELLTDAWQQVVIATNKILNSAVD